MQLLFSRMQEEYIVFAFHVFQYCKLTFTIEVQVLLIRYLHLLHFLAMFCYDIKQFPE